LEGKQDMSHVAIVLAAGKSTRMRSRLPKVAHPIVGRPMLAHVLAAAASTFASDAAPHPADEPPLGDTEDHSTRLLVVLGHEAESVQQALQATPDLPPYRVALQAAQLGTGDAVRATQRPLRGTTGARAADTILVLYGDTPLVRPATLRALLDAHAHSGATLSFVTGEADRPTDYGRVLRDAAGRVRGVVEERHATAEQRRIPEVNSGIYCFVADWLWSRLDQLEPHATGEYYLTDLVNLAATEGRPIATVSAPLSETAGVNDRIQLAEAGALLRRRLLDDLMLSGVTVVDPVSTFVDAGVRVGQDTTLYPFTTLQGKTVIGEGCAIGPHSVVRDSQIGDGCLVLGSWVEESVMEPGARIGPMSHLRPGAHLARGAYLGNFAEVKNSTIGADVQMHHFSYVGDATIGADSNIGAGVVTVNYDGERKHHTEVGEGAFLGCDTMLIAPLTIGDAAVTGAGAVVKHDVPPGGVAVGMPARVIRHREHRASPTLSRSLSQPDPASGAPDAPGVAPASEQDAAPPQDAHSEQQSATAREPLADRAAPPGPEAPSRTSTDHGTSGATPGRGG
jgi:bifunctional UDP-N-acetylglucosamine pyrophosphorylase/glucosamine-1-phosphate N-acetyltransferase